MSKLVTLFGQDLTGKTVQLRQSFFRKGAGYKASEHLFKCSGGFGCAPSSIGRAVFGTFLSDGEKARVDRGDVEYIVE
jgi:hypothetical protein